MISGTEGQLGAPTISYAPFEPNEQQDYSHLTFSRGWAISSSGSLSVPEYWRSTNIGDRTLHWDPRLEFAQSSNSKATVILLGHAIDLANNDSNLASISRSLQSKLSESRSSYSKAVEWLCGRYIAIDFSMNLWRIQSDAVGMRSIYYQQTHGVIGSHQNLVAELTNTSEPSVFGSSKWRQENKKAVCYPGNETHWKDIKFLNANHELSLSTMEAKRIELRKPDELSAEEAASRVVDLMRLQLPHLADKAKSKPMVSITAGQDSRTTLAALRPSVNDFHFFTYALTYSRRLKAVLLDIEGSQKLVDAAGVADYTLINLDGPLQNEALLKVLRRNSVKSSNLNVAEAYLRNLPKSDLHIRSSFNEVGIAAYRSKYSGRTVDADLLSDILTFEGGYSAETLESAQSYIDSTNLLEVDGYDPLDLWYWEVRMGSWLGTILHESDISFDTHILIGSREIIRLLLSVPLHDRINNKTYDQLITNTWPELYDFPVNGIIRTTLK